MSNQSFAALGVSANTVEALAADGIDKPFPIQALVVPGAGHSVQSRAKSDAGREAVYAFLRSP